MINLWNVGDGKTRLILDYLSRLEPKVSFDLKQLFKFDVILKRAKEQIDLSKKLTTIGYRVNKQPLIYEWCLK